jgi:hypothetical protein
MKASAVLTAHAARVEARHLQLPELPFLARPAMSQPQTKFQRATVAAAFDSQGGADEALLELRALGFPDRRIGYFTPGPGRHMIDLLADRNRLVAAVIGGVVGGAIGVGFVYLLHRLGAAGHDPLALYTLLGIIGVFAGGAALGFRGVCVERDDAVIPGDAQYVLTVEAGGNGGAARDTLRRRGGHELPVTPAVG